MVSESKTSLSEEEKLLSDMKKERYNEYNTANPIIETNGKRYYTPRKERISLVNEPVKASESFCTTYPGICTKLLAHNIDLLLNKDNTITLPFLV